MAKIFEYIIIITTIIIIIIIIVIKYIIKYKDKKEIFSFFLIEQKLCFTYNIQ